MAEFDVIIAGGGIVGLATALELLRAAPHRRVMLFDKEPTLGAHQTGHNSGVIHSGLYYRPGSQKADLCTQGREALVRYCEARGIPFERCGKLVVATNDAEVGRLDELERRGHANGLRQLRRLRKEELYEYEPHVAGISGLWVGETGIVDYRRVAAAYGEDIRARGGDIRTGISVHRAAVRGSELMIDTDVGSYAAKYFIGCVGLGSDRLAYASGFDVGVRIVPFRGEYYEVVPKRRQLIRNLIYPVPDPAFPFLGVHFTRRITGEIEAGPNAVLALKREGYRKIDPSMIDIWSTFSYPGFWKLAARYWRTGVLEMWRSLSKAAFVASLQRLVPEIEASDLRSGGAGVRAQALSPDGSLLDDFAFAQVDRMLFVLNAPSPAATASLAIGRILAQRVLAA